MKELLQIQRSVHRESHTVLCNLEGKRRIWEVGEGEEVPRDASLGESVLHLVTKMGRKSR
jgi:hypothetical protein